MIQALNEKMKTGKYPIPTEVSLELIAASGGVGIQGPVVCVSREDVIQALNEMETGKDPIPTEVSLELIAASGGVGIQGPVVCVSREDDSGIK